jgi:hypothetical protein
MSTVGVANVPSTEVRQHIAEMVGGPGYFRFFVQPTIAILLGVRQGIRDRRIGHPVYLMGLIRVPASRRHRLREDVRALAVPLVVALVAAYASQYIIRSRIYIGYGLLYATLFVVLPYLAARGIAHRLARRLETTASPPRPDTPHETGA